jgi:flagellar basal body-associated protein FliL
MSEASTTPAKPSKVRLAILLVVCLVAGIGVIVMTRSGEEAATKESKAEARAQQMAEQSKQDSPPPLVKEIIATPEAPPTRGPMKSLRP